MTNVKATIIALARRVIDAGRMNPQAQAEAEQLIAQLSNADATETETLAEFTSRATAAFEASMQPVAKALAAALHNDDPATWQGLRALLPGLLREVNQDRTLEDLFAYQLGRTIVDELKGEPA